MFWITISAVTTETGEPIAVPWDCLPVLLCRSTENTSKLFRVFCFCFFFIFGRAYIGRNICVTKSARLILGIYILRYEFFFLGGGLYLKGLVFGILRHCNREIKSLVYAKQQTWICTTWPNFSLPFTVYCFHSKISSFTPDLSIKMVLDSFFLLIFFSEKFST